MTKRQLEARAKEMPSMVYQAVKDKLREYASKVEDGMAIVEVGTWLGACTASMMLGVKDSKKDVEIHMYDRFITYQSQIAKAEKFGVVLNEGKEYLTLVKQYLNEYNIKYIANMGDNRKAKYDGKRKIGLFVDDASKKKEYFLHTINTFKPHFIPNVTLVALMDYWYFEKKPNKGYDCQYEYMKNNEQFEYLFRIENENGEKTSEAFFLFKG